MQIQPRDEHLIDFVFDHYTVTLDHIWKNIFPDSTDSRVVRRRVNMMLAEKLLAETRAQVLTRTNNVHVPVFYPTERAARLMVERTGKLRYLHAPTSEPYSRNLAHFVALTDLRLLVHKAAARAAPLYALEAYYNQFDVANASAVDPSEHFRLHVTVQKEPRPVYCVPDFAMAFRAGGHLMAMYGELERESTAVEKAARKKNPGFALLYEKQLHKKHFPGAADQFRVLVISLHAEWRDKLRFEFSSKPHSELYRFAALASLTEQSFFFEPVWHPCTGKPEPLFKVRPPDREGAPGRTPQAAEKE